MSTDTRVNHPIYSLLPTEVEGFDSLANWPWICAGRGIHATDEVWRQLDPTLWEHTQEPLGGPADGLARQTCTRAGRPCLS